MGLLVFARHVLSMHAARCFYKKPEPTWGKGKEDGNCVALSFAGIIQIRYEGYLSPGRAVWRARTPSEAAVYHGARTAW